VPHQSNDLDSQGLTHPLLPTRSNGIGGGKAAINDSMVTMDA